MNAEFENFIARVDTILGRVAISINREDSDRSLAQRLKYHWKGSINLLAFKLSILFQIVWMVLGIATHKSLLQITYIIPCIALCMLGDFRLCSLIYYADSINKIIECLKILNISNRPNEEFSKDVMMWFKFLTYIANVLVYLTYFGLTMFLLAPIIIMSSYYYAYGEVKLFLPFLLWYPFDEYDIHFWPIAFAQQTQSAWMSIHTVVGADCLFFTCCTFIYLQFILLQEDLKRLINENSQSLETVNETNTFEQEFVEILNRHRELIRCVELLECVYSKPTLFNVITSSMIICATGFNLMTLDDYIYTLSFICFLVFGMVQVNLYCYYGDYVMRSSLHLGDAIYESDWYDTRVAVRRSLLIVLIRSQKPCKFTAYGYANINLGTFTRILSKSWSYFALLNQMYHN